MNEISKLEIRIAELEVALKDLQSENAILKQQFDIVNAEYQAKIKEQQATHQEMEVLLNKLEEVIVEYQEKDDQLLKEHTLLEAAYYSLEEKNEELKQKNFELAQLDEMKSNFLAMISHELRTPITIVQGNTEILMGHLDMLTPDQTQTLLESMFARIRDLIIMVESLLSLAGIEANNFQLNRQWVDFSKMLAKAREHVMPLVSRKNIDFQIRISKDIPPLFLDASRLDLVIINILSNAVKFNRTNGQVILEASFIPKGEDGQPEVLIVVQDTGIGIHPSKQKEIFSKFFQVDNSNTRSYGGSGLGLALATEVIDMHNGKIWVESELGSGATFFIRLPQPPEALNSDPKKIVSAF